MTWSLQGDVHPFKGEGSVEGIRFKGTVQRL